MNKKWFGFAALVLLTAIQMTAWACPMSEGGHKGEAAGGSETAETVVSKS